MAAVTSIQASPATHPVEALKATLAKPATTTKAAAVLASAQTTRTPALSLPPVPGNASPVPPGRLENPGHQQGTALAPLAFGPSASASALTRSYDANGNPVPPEPQGVNLFQRPARGLNILA